MPKFKPDQGAGDDGNTWLFNERVKKTDLRIFINSILDEAQAALAISVSKKKSKEINRLQADIIDLSAAIAGFKKEAVLTELEKKFFKLSARNKTVLKTKKFVIFGEDEAAAFINMARTKIRLAELLAWKAKLKKAAICLNRLSDYLFLLSLEA